MDDKDIFFKTWIAKSFGVIHYTLNMMKSPREVVVNVPDCNI